MFIWGYTRDRLFIVDTTGHIQGQNLLDTHTNIIAQGGFGMAPQETLSKNVYVDFLFYWLFIVDTTGHIQGQTMQPPRHSH